MRSIAVVCQLLSDPENGKVSNGAVEYQSVSNFSCTAGYLMDGPKSIHCQADGTWSENMPTCRSKQQNVHEDCVKKAYMLMHKT